MTEGVRAATGAIVLRVVVVVVLAGPVVTVDLVLKDRDKALLAVRVRALVLDLAVRIVAPISAQAVGALALDLDLHVAMKRRQLLCWN